MPTRSRPLTAAALAATVSLVLGLAGCGADGDAAPRPDSSSTASPSASPSASTSVTTPSATPSALPTASAPRPLAIVVDDLAAGPPPQLDVVVDGTLLLHDGREILVPDGLSRPLGSYDGRTYAVQGTADGDQLVTVADDGSLTPLGKPYLTYNHFPQLVAETGHVLFVFQDRGGSFVLWVVDARTGKELEQVRGNGRREPDYSSLGAADRTVAESWDGVTTESPGDVFARSADGSHEVVADVTDAAGGPPTVLTLRRTSDGGDASAFAFPFPDPDDSSPVVLVDDIAFESNDAFLVKAATGSTGRPTYVVLRCTAAGTCERVAGPAKEIQIAGTDAVVADLTG